MPLIEVKRGSDVGAIARRMKILVGDRVVARLRRGESENVQVLPGLNTVQARLDWLRSTPLELNLKEDEFVVVTASLTERSWSFTGAFLKPSTAIELRPA